MDETIVRRVVLYADIAGSTRLYETHGDEVARADVAACLDVLAGVTARCGGRVVKTIGDEVMCVFADPARAATAASEMHEALQEASEAGRFRTGTLRIKVGWHYGAVYIEDDGEVRGEAPVTAQQVIRMAKAGQVLCSGQALAALPAAFRRGARFVDRVDAEARPGVLEAWELPWEEGDDLTQVGQADLGAVIVHRRLTLEHDGQVATLDASRPQATLGRGADNDLVVHGRFASRVHARLGWRHGRFHLRDDSTNGTVLVPDEGEALRLHREETMLPAGGRFCLGATPEEDPDAVVRFRCE